MGILADKLDHAGGGFDAHRRFDRGKTSPRIRAGRIAGGLILLASYLLVAAAAFAEPIRIATWHGDFSRKGPGLLLNELLSDKPVAGLETIVQTQPDILLLTDFDYDAGLAAVTAFRGRLAKQGARFDFVVSEQPNTGVATGLDIDRDGRKGGPRDAQGFGFFAGQGGQVLLSRFPLELVQDKTDVLWRDVPGSLIAADDPAYDVQRLSSSAHWAVRAAVGETDITLLTLAATPPIFDGPEDRNGRRNHDEVLLWHSNLSDKTASWASSPVVVLGNFNLDPTRGDGRHRAAKDMLAHPRLQDPLAGVATVSWDRVGDMRVSYVLPDSSLEVETAGVMRDTAGAGRHGLVWVDLDFPDPAR